MKRFFLMCVISALCFLGSRADSLAEVDSLLQVYEQSKGDTHTTIGRRLLEIYSDYPVYFDKPLSIDNDISDREQDVIVWFTTERFYTVYSYYSEALKFNERTLPLVADERQAANPALWDDLYAILLCDRSYCLFKTSDYTRAVEAAQQAKEFCQRTNNVLQLSRAYLYLSLVNHSLRNYDEAKTLVVKAIDTNAQLGLNSQTHNLYGVACELFCSAGEVDQAISYGVQAVEAAREMDEQAAVANHLTQLAYAYDRKGDYQRGLEVANEAIAIVKRLEPLDRNQLALTLEYKSWNLIDLKRNREAVEALREAIALEQSVGNASAVRYDYRTLSEALEPIDVHEALVALRRCLTMTDSLHTQEMKALTMKANAEVHNDELIEENAESHRVNRIITISFIIVVLLLAALAAALWFASRQKSRVNRALKQLAEARETFFTNVTHEFRTPLTVIMGIGEELESLSTAGKDDIPKEELPNMGKTLLRQSRQLLTLVSQIMDIAKVKTALGQQPQTQGNVASYVAMVVERYQEMARQKGVSIHYDADEDGIETSYVADYVEKLVGNLLSNAVKFTPEGGQVGVSLHHSAGELQLKVSDSGTGIAPEHLPHIFEPFYKADSPEGTGVGLALVKQIVDELKGDIKVESQEGKGTTFSVTLKAEQKPNDSAAGKTQQLPTLLIVEDNADVAALIDRQLQGHYNASFAADGRQGINMARELMPDLIITDLMMPGTDGLELCRTIRANEVTNHIPIIVVTAKATEEDRLGGLRAGADAYLYKPFNADELRIRVEKLLEQRAVLQHKFSIGAKAKAAPEADTAAAAEKTPFADPSEKFAQSVKQAVIELIDNKECDVEHLAAKLFLSQTQLRSKFAAVMGGTPKKYILNLQLDIARQMLLEHPERLITDVADRCGFYDKSHFTRLFREAYGLTPGEYQKKQKSAPADKKPMPFGQ